MQLLISYIENVLISHCYFFNMQKIDLSRALRQAIAKPPSTVLVPSLRQRSLQPLKRITLEKLNRHLQYRAEKQSSRIQDLSMISFKGNYTQEGVHSILNQSIDQLFKIEAPKNRVSLVTLLQKGMFSQSISRKTQLYLSQSELLLQELRQKDSMTSRMITLIREAETTLIDIVIRLCKQVEGKESSVLKLQHDMNDLWKECNTLKQRSKLSCSHQRNNNTNQSTFINKTFNKQTQSITKLVFQNSKLMAEIKQLEMRLKEDKNLQITIDKLKQTETILKIKESELIQSKSLMQGYKQRNELIQFELKAYKNLIQENKDEIQSLSEQIKQCNLQNERLVQKIKEMEKVLRFRQLFWMQREQYQQTKVLLVEGTKLRQLLQKKIQKMKAKISSMIVLVGKQVEIPEGTGGQKKILQTLRESLFKEEGMKKVLMVKQDGNTFVSLTSGKISTSPIILNDTSLDEKLVDMSKLRYKLPNFIIFFKQYSKAFRQELRSIQYRQIYPEIFTQIRIILDARHNQMLTAIHWKNFTCFVDFLFGFFQKFQIDLHYKRVARVQQNEYNPIAKDKIRMNFILDLINPKLDDVWEIKTFRQFIFQNASNEEMYFYLHYRRIIFKGSAHRNYFTTSSPVLFVECHQALAVADLALSRYQKNYLQKIKNAIISKKRLKGNKYVVDGHFVLRTLLQLYRLQRLNRLNFIQDSFKMMVTAIDDEVYIPFRSFKQFMETNFSYLTFCQIAEIFRQCFNLGDGILKAQVFFMIGSKGFFVKLLKLRSQVTEPNILAAQASFQKIGTIISKDIKNLSDALCYFGVQQVDKNVRKIFQFMQNRRSLNELAQYYQGQCLLSIVNTFKYYFGKLLQLQTIFNGQYDQFDRPVQIIEKELHKLETLVGKVQLSCNPMLQFQFSKKRAGRLLTSYMGEKTFKFYATLGKKINAKLRQKKSS